MRLQRNAMGRLTLAHGESDGWAVVVPVRAFPIQAPEQGISLMGADGHEKAWIDRLDALPDEQRRLIQEELHSREFMPVIRRLLEVSSFATPSTWSVETDRGPTQLVLKGEEDIRRLGRDVLLISDSHGVQFMIQGIAALDRHSRKLLDRFL